MVVGVVEERVFEARVAEAGVVGLELELAISPLMKGRGDWSSGRYSRSGESSAQGVLAGKTRRRD